MVTFSPVNYLRLKYCQKSFYLPHVSCLLDFLQEKPLYVFIHRSKYLFLVSILLSGMSNNPCFLYFYFVKEN